MGPNFDRHESLEAYLSLRLMLATIDRMHKLWQELDSRHVSPDATTVIANRGFYLDLEPGNRLIRLNADKIMSWLEPPDTYGATADPRAQAFKKGCGFTYSTFILQLGHAHMYKLGRDAAEAGGLLLPESWQLRDGPTLEMALREVTGRVERHLDQDSLLNDYLEGYAAKSVHHWSEKYFFKLGGGFTAYSLAVAEAYPRMLAGQVPAAAPDHPHSDIDAAIEAFLKDVQDGPSA